MLAIWRNLARSFLASQYIAEQGGHKARQGSRTRSWQAGELLGLKKEIYYTHREWTELFIENATAAELVTLVIGEENAKGTIQPQSVKSFWAI